MDMLLPFARNAVAIMDNPQECLFDLKPYLLPEAQFVPVPCHVTKLGALFSGDCLETLRQLKKETADTILFDPPVFNFERLVFADLSVLQPENSYANWPNDGQTTIQVYMAWYKERLDECLRILRPGGALFVVSQPKLIVPLGEYLSIESKGIEFRYRITVPTLSGMMIPGPTCPSHYSLFYYTKGMPRIFYRSDREASVNPDPRMLRQGAILKEEWADMPFMDRWESKSKKHQSKVLPIQFMERVIDISTLPGDLVLDPFGGSGTTFVACETKGRRWIGMEINFAEDIVDRLTSADRRP